MEQRWWCDFRTRGHARAAPYFFTFHTIICTMGSKEARNSRKALSLLSSLYLEVTSAVLSGEGRHYTSDRPQSEAISWVMALRGQRDSPRRTGEGEGGERRGVVAARGALAARSVRTRRPALKMDSTAGVRLRLTSTIHSKFVFSRNSPDGGRPPDRFPKRAPTCSVPQPIESWDAGQAEPHHGLCEGSYVRNTENRAAWRPLRI